MTRRRRAFRINKHHNDVASPRRSLITSRNANRALQARAVKAALDIKRSFYESRPPSLHDQGKSCVAPFKKNEIVLSKLLGTGQFSNVYAIKSFRIRPSIDQYAAMSDAEMASRLHLKKIEEHRQTKTHRYALKHIKGNFLDDHRPEEYIKAIG